MEDTLITFETAKLAKEKGFEFKIVWEYILGFKDNHERDKYLPTQSLLQKWLREKYNQHIYLFPLDNGKWGFENNSISINLDHIFINYMYEGKKYNSYEEALEAGLQEVLKLVKF